jgi:hypothetical protein
MNAIRFSLAVAALGASGLTFAAGAFEGGAASEGLTFEPAVTGASRARADVAAEGRAAQQAINSRSGHQGISEATRAARVVSNRSRDEVRAEALVSVRERQPVFEGGESTAQVQRQDRVQPSTTLASTGSVRAN